MSIKEIMLDYRNYIAISSILLVVVYILVYDIW